MADGQASPSHPSLPDLEKSGAEQSQVVREERFAYDEADVKSLVRKIDWRIMPFLWGYAVLSAVDVCAYQLDQALDDCPLNRIGI